MTRFLLIGCLACSSAALAQDAGTKKAPAKPPAKGGKAQAPKVDLGLPTSYGALPKADLAKPKADNGMEGPTATASNSGYSVVKIQHAKAFARSPTGSVPMGAFEVLPLAGKPLSTEKFTTVIRVKSPQRATASIELSIVDLRGDTLMSSSGTVTWRGTKGDEVDYSIDWDPTPCRAGGDYTLMVRIGGQEMGTWPMKFAEVQGK